MLRVRTSEALPGMVLALPLGHPKRPGTLLLKAGARLNRRSIMRLGELGVREMWVRYPGLEVIADRARAEVLESHAELGRRVSECFDPVLADAHAHLEFGVVRRSISQLLEQLVASPRAAVYVREVLDRDESFSRHATNVCVLSLLLGLKLDGYLIAERSRLTSSHARDVTGLGLGAMVHDIGVLRLPDGVVDRWHASQDESDPEWHSHVEVGYEAVRGEIEPSAAAVVLHHHQRYDGTGYPGRETAEGYAAPGGQSIHVFARIAAVADAFDRLRFQGEWYGVAGPGVIPRVRALRLMLEEPMRGRFDPVVLGALLEVVPPFAPGEVVTLSDGRSAVVLDWDPRRPCRPTVQTVDLGAAARGRGYPEGERIDLREEGALRIVRAEGEGVEGESFEVRWERGVPALADRPARVQEVPGVVR